MSYGTGRGKRAFRPEEVNDIRMRYARGGETYISLARRYEVSEQTIARIITGRTYMASTRAGGEAQASVGLIPMPGVLTEDYIADATKRIVEQAKAMGKTIPVVLAPEVDNAPPIAPDDDPYAKD